MFTYFLGNKGSDLKTLLESSTKLFGEGEVLSPSLRRLRLSAFNHLVAFSGFFLAYYTFHRGLGIAMIAGAILVLLPYSFFYHVRMKACQTWMVYTTITKNTSSWEDALAATGRQKWSLRFFGLAEWVIASQKGNREKQGILAQMLVSALETVFDLAEDFLLPAVVIEQQSLTEVVPKLEKIKTNIPASLTGAFGLDLFGNAISAFLFLAQAAIVLAGLGIGVVAARWVPSSYLTPLPQAIRNAMPAISSNIFLLPAIAALFISSFLGRVLKISVSSIKDTYFAVFYTSINRPLEIRENLRENLTHYLKVEDRSYTQTVKAELKRKFPEMSQGPVPVRPSESRQLQTIEKFFQENVGKHSLDKIHEHLSGKGYADEQIRTVMARYKKIG